MNFYCRLQFRSLKRSLEEAGLHIAAACVLLVLGYAGLFYAAKQSPTVASLILLFVQYSLVQHLNDQDRRDFLKQLFPSRSFTRLLLYENTLVTLPLALVAVYSSAWLAVLGLIILPVVYYHLATWHISTASMPTPFSRKPFEFIILFRRWWFVFVILHMLLGIALYVGNENLAFILLFVQIILSLQAYDVVEDELLVWNYSLSPQAFLQHKVTRGILHCLLLSAPMLFALLIAYPENVLIIALIVIVGLLLLLLSILMKYSSYPRRPGLMEILLTISAVVTMILIPYLYYYFYKKSIHQFQKYL
ncbi:hypothetical protein [Sphingobacterium corticibacter]|uniref:Uncharacterized protein n=1 Tax=Sphingobacterium corticibacter TaxID=2171749 RepID=A0A2T8HJA3_9SPHI|nr:hypothetical protein [Sphingobacterium corticibacter]PVH25450.1 hypothetical protein DC487_11100 [Sphingobacterium corticibacter]